MKDPQGPFGGMARLREFEREGKKFVLLHRGGTPEWCIEVELATAGLGEIRGLSPDENWKLARETDAKQDPPVEVGGPDDARLH